ncbi:phospholipase A and acyltransferase 4-like [Onychostoma macrolepis]|uniref:phospholipase A and acyltransferase 4-like n=1 Tax=Onychostoma macrolepis TaxID=369639 RepID=UPI00272C930E|nr:phospholipase A and acyltransferase 4-like [Onychostoma macrolepis]
MTTQRYKARRAVIKCWKEFLGTHGTRSCSLWRTGVSAEDKEPKPADLIEIFRGGYQHWAIYVGDGNVIHLVPPSEHADVGVSRVKSVLHDEATVKKEQLQDVVGSDKYRIHNLLDEQHEPRPIQDILLDADSLVGKTRPYNLFTHNCEHFVTLLRYGTPQSQQVPHIQN